MDRVEAYRRHAADCRRLAETVKNDESRAILLEMAESWEMLAAERLNALDQQNNGKR